MCNEISNDRGPTTSEFDDKTFSKQHLINGGYQERKHFWYKRNRYGTVQIPIDTKSSPITLNGDGEVQVSNNYRIKKQVGILTVIENDPEKLFDSFGKLIIPGGKI